MTDASTFDILWIIIASAMVMLMQGGFTLLETGLVRAKNSINVAIKNFVDFCVSGAVFWLIGYAIMFGASSSGWFGTTGFLFGRGASPALMAFFIFQLVFAGTATTIVSGAVAERMTFSGYLIVSLVIMTVIYPVIGHWIWGGIASGTPTGWLEQRGFIDFAGATVVHSTGGWVALAAVLIIGARKGRFDGKGVTFNSSNLPLTTLGALVLWFGWFGFNGGSLFAVTDQIPLVIANTVLAGAFGGVAGLSASWVRSQRAEVGSTINGALAGLVAITASAHIQSVEAAVMIGATSGILAFFVERALINMQIDDVVGAVPVHGAGGVWGTVAAALFADVSYFGGLTRMEQLLIQLGGAFSVFLYAFGIGFILLWIINRLVPLRVSLEDEDRGLNVAEHGARTALLVLLEEMEDQRVSGDLSRRVTVEPFSEVGSFARQYNSTLSEIEKMVTEARDENQQLQESIFQLLQDVTTIADGDLTIEAQVKEDATGAIADSFNFMVEQLREVIDTVRSTSEQLSTATNEIQATAEQLSFGSSQQASQIVDTSSAIDEMSISIQQVSENSAMSAAVGEQARANAQRGTEAVNNTIEGMSRIRSQVQSTSKRIKRLGESTQEIGQMLGLIRNITKRTSILALNASIQASRAGEEGHAFMVVAEEVEQLAERSAEAAAQIETLVRDIQSEMGEAVASMDATTQEVVTGSELANEAGDRLAEIETVSTRLAELIQSISLASSQQARGSETIARSMNEIAGVTQQTASGTAEASESIRNMAQLADEMRSVISVFKLETSQQSA